jgi:flagellar hook-length control protein FliK
MDAQVDSPAVTWVHAGRDRAEAGFEDPALGWVAVRAEMGAGGVHAAIVPGTAEAAQALGGHMAGLSAHLAEQRVAVSAVSINSPGNSAQLAGGGAGENGGQQWTGRGQQQSAQSGASQAAAGVAGAAAKAAAPAAGALPQAATVNGRTGSYISVVA